MKTLFLFTIILCSSALFAQSPEEYFNSGVKKSAAKDYTGAIEDFTKAAGINPGYALAYYYRGLAESALGNYEDALADYDKAVQLKPGAFQMILTRGILKFNKHDLESAVKDFSDVINLDEGNATAFYYRGYAKLYLGTTDACYDLIKAVQLGEPNAKELMDKYCVKSTSTYQPSNEYLKVDWPAEEGWHLIKQDENSVRKEFDLQRYDNAKIYPKEMASMIIYKNINANMKISLTQTRDKLYDDAKKNCSSAVVITLDKDETAKYPWILFKIECEFESQIWYAVQTTDQLFAVNWGVKEKHISSDKQDEWLKIFKSSQIIKATPNK